MLLYLHRLGWLVGLVLVQVLVLNQMHIDGYATPFLYIYFILQFNSRVGRNELMLWAFALGLVIDMFSNTPGMNAAAATCLAFFRTPLLRLVTLRDMDEAFYPSVKSLGVGAYSRLVVLCSLLFCLVFWMIDVFSFSNLLSLFGRIVTSTLTTVICILCMDAIRRDRA